LVIYQESVHDARSTKCKKKIEVNRVTIGLYMASVRGLRITELYKHVNIRLSCS